MTAWEVYLIMQADNLIAFFIVCAVVSVFVTGTIFFMYIFAEIEGFNNSSSKKDKTEQKLTFYGTLFAILTFIFAFAAITMPNTKTLIAMCVVPKLTSEEAKEFVQKEYSDWKQILQDLAETKSKD